MNRKVDLTAGQHQCRPDWMLCLQPSGSSPPACWLHRAPRRADPAGLIDLDAIEAPWRTAGLEIRLRR